jgi:hypothetical protein
MLSVAGLPFVLIDSLEPSVSSLGLNSGPEYLFVVAVPDSKHETQDPRHKTDVLVGNRSEALGGAHVTAKEDHS